MIPPKEQSHLHKTAEAATVETNLFGDLLFEACRTSCRAHSKMGKQTQSARQTSQGAAFYPGDEVQLLKPIYLCQMKYSQMNPLSLEGTYFFSSFF